MLLSKHIFFNTFFQIAGKIITAGIALLTIHILASYLPSSALADYGTLYSVLAVFSAVADMGIYTLLLRDMGTSPENAARKYALGITLRFLLSLFVLSLVSVVVFFLPAYQSSFVAVGMPIAVMGTFFALMSGVVSAALQYALRIQFFVGALIVGKMITFLGLLLITQWIFPVFSETAFVSLLWAGVFGSAIAFLGTVFFAKKIFPLRFFFDASALKLLFLKALPFGLSALFAMLYFQMGMLSFRFLLDSADAVLAESRYFVVIRIVEVLLTFPVFFMASWLSGLSSFIAQKNTQQLQKSLSLGMSFLFVLGSFLAGYLLVFASDIVRIMASDTFLTTENAWGSNTVLQVFAVALVFAFLNIFLSYVLLAFEKQKIVLFRNVLAVGIGMIGLLVFVPLWGMVGAAVSTLCAEILIFAWSFYLLRKEIIFPFFWKSFFQTLFSIGVTITFFLLFDFSFLGFGIFLTFFLQSLFFFLIFFFLLSQIGFFTPEIKKIFSK